MNARHAARELALLTLFQMDRQGNGQLDVTAMPREKLRELMMASIRTLSSEAETLIQNAADELADVSRSMLAYELEAPENLESPIDAEVQPVPIPTTRETIDRIERCLQGAEYLFEALRLPEILALMRGEEVQSYAIKLMQLVAEHRDALDEQINRHLDDWRMDRLVKMDAYILRLATAEMRHMPNVDLRVSINEAVDLAKQFSTDESYRLINGVLGSLAPEVAEQTGKPIARSEIVSS